MRKFIQFLADYWYVPLFILLVILGWVLFRRKGTPVAQTKAELAAIEAGRVAREIQAREGVEAAKRHLVDQYTAELAALDEKQQEKARELRDDPAKLARFLVRAGRRDN